MADSNPYPVSYVTLELKRGETVYSVRVTANMLDLLHSSSLDAASRQTLLNNILNEQLLMGTSGAPEVSSLVGPREVSNSPPVTTKSFEMSSLAKPSKEVSKSPPVTTKSSEISSLAKPSKEVSKSPPVTTKSSEISSLAKPSKEVSLLPNHHGQKMRNPS